MGSDILLSVQSHTTNRLKSCFIFFSFQNEEFCTRIPKALEKLAIVHFLKLYYKNKNIFVANSGCFSQAARQRVPWAIPLSNRSFALCRMLLHRREYVAQIPFNSS